MTYGNLLTHKDTNTPAHIAVGTEGSDVRISVRGRGKNTRAAELLMTREVFEAFLREITGTWANQKRTGSYG